MRMWTCSQTCGVPERRSGALAISGKLRKWRAAGIGRSRTMRQSYLQHTMCMPPPLEGVMRISALAGATPPDLDCGDGR